MASGDTYVMRTSNSSWEVDILSLLSLLGVVDVSGVGVLVARRRGT